jgi:tight adherence protein B
VVDVTALAALCGAGIAGGLALLAAWVRGVPMRGGAPRDQHRVRPWARPRLGPRAAVVACALGVGLLTRWPVGLLLGGLLGWAWPSVFSGGQATRQAIARVDAVATWTEMLRGMTASAASVEQALIATVPVAPAPLRLELEEFARRIAVQQVPLPAALRSLAGAIDDEVGDLVVAALLVAATPSQRSGGLSAQLAELATAAREKATMRLRVLTGQARLHAAARLITLITLGVIAVLLIFDRPFLAPYGTEVGQLALLGVSGIFAGGFAGLTRLGREPRGERLLSQQPERPPSGGRP